MWRLGEKLEQSSVWCGVFVNCSWVVSRWQQHSTHLHTNSTQNNKMLQHNQNKTYITIRIHEQYNQYTHCTALGRSMQNIQLFVQWYKIEQKVYEKYDETNSHISSKSHTIYIYSNNEIHPVTKTSTPLHHICRHFTSTALIFTQLHFTTL